jgi:AcrR family transcriptional regulator
MATKRSGAAVLAASERAALYLVERGGLDAPIAEIAAAIGLHERTFYRYFPTKPDLLRPVFDWGAALLADRIAGRGERPLRETVVEAFAEVVAGEHADRTAKLFPVVFADPALRAVLLAVYHDAEDEFRIALAARGGLDVEAPSVYLAAASLVTATRLALELFVDRWVDPVETLRELLELLPDRLIGEFVDDPIG